MMRKMFSGVMMTLIVSAVIGLFGIGVMQAQVPSGTPSRLRVLSLGANTAAPSTNGNITATGTVTATNFVGTFGGVAGTDFARLSQLNTFTGGQTFAAGGETSLTLRDTSAATDEKNYRFRSVGGQLVLSAYSDSFGTNSNPIAINRTGIVTDTIDLSASNIGLTGFTTFNTPVSGTNAGIKTSSVTPGMIVDETDAPADERYWRVIPTAGVLSFTAMNDLASGENTWLAIDRSGTTVTSIDFTSTTLTWNGTPLRASGTFTAVFSAGCTAPQNVTVDWQRAGNSVSMRFFAPTACVSNNTSYNTTAAPVPAAIRPASNANSGIMPNFTNNSTNVAGCIQVDFTGNISFGMMAALTSDCFVGTTWTAAGNKGFTTAKDFTYMLGDP